MLIFIDSVKKTFPHDYLALKLKIAIPKATPTFKDSFCPYIGICTTVSLSFKSPADTPLTSLPTISAILRTDLNFL